MAPWIWTVTPDGQDRRQIGEAIPVYPYDSNLRPGPDGKKILFGARDAGYLTNIYILDVQSGSLQRLTNDGLSDHPSWSPGGNQIAYDRAKAIEPNSVRRGLEIWIMSHDGKNQQRLIHSDGAVDHIRPVWRPNGREIAYISKDPAEIHWALWSMDLLSGERRLIFKPEPENASIRGFDWTPDGESIVLSLSGQLYIIRSDGTDLRQLVKSNASDELPILSPDGTKVAFRRFGGPGAGGYPRATYMYLIFAEASVE